MKNIAGVFAVSFIAIMSVVAAHADVASTDLVDRRFEALATVASTGSYNDLTNKPTIPAAQVQPDWNATTGMGAIKNKPTLGALASKASVTSAEITDGTIVNADISATAGIAPSKINIDKLTTYDTTHTDNDERIPSVKVVESIAAVSADAALVAAKNVYQVKSNANYQMGSANGAWTTMSGSQQNALNSGITTAKVTKYDNYATGKQDTLTPGSNGNIKGAGSVTVTKDASGVITVSGTDTNTVTTATTTGTGNVDSAITANNGALTVTKGVTAATPGDITNAINALDVAASTAAGNVVTNVSQTDGKISVTKGTISVPTVNNATLTIKQGGAVKGTFTANQATAATIELTDNNTTYTASGSNGVSASVSGTSVNVSGVSATRDAVGVAKLGVIPVGTTGTATATIWVE